MRNRLDLPDNIRYMQRLPDDGTIALRAGRHLCMTWRAPQKKIPVVMVSTDSSAKMITVPSRNSYRQTLLKPQAVDLYNHNMNGVDKADQLTVFYPFIRKTRKWWRKLFFWLVEVAVINSYILYKKEAVHPLTLLNYRRAVVMALATDFIRSRPEPTHPGHPRTSQLSLSSGDTDRLTQKFHRPGKREQQRMCRVCHTSRTLYYCETCTSHPTLCPVPCFGDYHSSSWP